MQTSNCESTDDAGQVTSWVGWPLFGWSGAVLVALLREPDGGEDIARQRQRIERQLEQLTEVYILGDLSQAAYPARREQLQAELSALPAPRSNPDEIIARTVEYLRDLPAAWMDADQAERSTILSTIFQ